MIAFGSVLSIIPVVLVGIFSYIQSSKQVQIQVNHAELQLIRQLNSNVEQILKTVDHTLTNMLESTVMEKALYNPLDASNFQLYNDLRSEIIHLQSFDTKVEEVVVLNRQQDWLFKNFGIKRLSGHADRDKYVSYFNLPHTSSWILLDNREFTESIPNLSCIYSISLVKKLPSIRTEKYGLAFANIPACSIADLMTPDQQAEEVMILDENRRIIVHRDTSKIGTLLSDQPLFQGADIDFGNASDQVRLTRDNRSYSVTYHKSGYNNWTYMSVVSIDQLTRESRQIGWFTLIVSSAIIAASILFVWLTTQRLYSPVSRLVKFVEGTGSGRDDRPKNEVQMIEDYIRQLFSSKSKLEYEIRDHNQQLRSLFLGRLYGGSLKPTEIAEKMNGFGFEGLTSRWRSMTVFALQVDTLDNTRYESKDMDLLLFAVSNIVEEAVDKERRLPVIWMDRTLAVLVGFAETDEAAIRDEMYKLTESIQSLIERYLGLSVSIGISQPFADMQQAAKAYGDGIEALRHRIKLGKGVIIPYSSLHAAGKPPMLYEYPGSAEHELIDAVKTADRDAAHRALADWVDAVVRKMQSPSDYQISLMRLLNRILTLKQESGIGFDQLGIRRDTLYQELLDLQMSEEIEGWFRDRLIVPLLRVFGERRDSQYHNLSEQIMDMIRNHYDAELTLEDCAAKLHYNANYLSSVFKNETGYTFTEYLSHYRLQMAKRWLTETDMTVKEIADRLKYYNSNNFIRAFRKQEGMTPGQYRAKYGSAAE